MTDESTSPAVRWDKRYRAAAEPPFGEAPNDYLRMICARAEIAAKTALSLADGDGRNGCWLAEQGFEVTAVDVSAVATERARSLDSRRGVTVERLTADLADWSPAAGRRWDLVALIYLQGTASLRHRALRIAAAAVAPGGWLVIEGFSKLQATRADMGPDDPDRLYDLDEVYAAAKDLEVVEALAGQVRLDEGSRHQGAAEVIRFTARRPA